MKKLGRYVLFFFVPLTEDIVELMQKQLREHDCSICSKKEICSLKQSLPARPIGVYDDDNISEMNVFIRYVYDQRVSEFAMLVDTVTEKTYLYIGGEDWKSNMEDVLFYSESLLGKTLNTEDVIDLRETLKFKAIPGMN